MGGRVVESGNTADLHRHSRSAVSQCLRRGASLRPPSEASVRRPNGPGRQARPRRSLWSGLFTDEAPR